VLNRGVHEPLEEYCFQTMLSKLKAQSPAMIELGAYWAHYSMWLQKRRPAATCFMIEPDSNNLNCGIQNFRLNGYRGEFIHNIVNATGLQLDAFMAARGIARFDILHCDIQGSELEMLSGSKKLLSERKADYIFVSTHSEALHSG